VTWYVNMCPVQPTVPVSHSVRYTKQRQPRFNRSLPAFYVKAISSIQGTCLAHRNDRTVATRLSRVTVVELGGLGGDCQGYGQYGVYFSCLMNCSAGIVLRYARTFQLDCNMS